MAHTLDWGVAISTFRTFFRTFSVKNGLIQHPCHKLTNHCSSFWRVGYRPGVHWSLGFQ